MTSYRQGSSPNFNRAARNGRTGDKSKAYLNEVKKRQQAHARFVRSFVFLFFGHRYYQVNKPYYLLV